MEFTESIQQVIRFNNWFYMRNGALLQLWKYFQFLIMFDISFQKWETRSAKRIKLKETKRLLLLLYIYYCTHKFIFPVVNWNS
jgi:hypothetical protein